MHIYKFTNIQTNESYIGQTIQDPNRRRLEHICDSRRSPKTYHFHNALRKYGIDVFTFEVIAEATSLDELNRLEEMYVEQYDSINNGYNIRKPGNNKLHSEESKKRMSEAQKAAHARRRANGGDGGWTRSDGGPMKGKKLTEEQRKFRSSIMKEVNRKTSAGKTWKVINGKRTWMEKS